MKEVNIISTIVGRNVDSLNVPSRQGASMDLTAYLLKKIWDEAFEVKTDANGNQYLFGKLPFATQYGITMYVDGGTLDLPSIFDGLPIDSVTLYWEETELEDGTISKILKSKSAGTLGALENVGEWADEIPEEDRIMVQKAGSNLWESLLLSKVGSASFENISESGEGNAFTSFVLSEDKLSLELVKGETFATKTEFDTLNTKVTDFLEGSDTDTIINKWKELEAFLSGMSESDDLAEILSGKADKTELEKYVTIAGDETITGEKNFTGGLKVNGGTIHYNSTSGYWKLEGDLLVTGGITMFASDTAFTPSTIMDALLLDENTLTLNEAGQLTVVGGGGSGSGTTTNALVLQANGMTIGTFDGSSAVTANFNYSNLGLDSRYVLQDGTGASGTWGISITGNSATATQLETPRTIWGQSFDGTDNVTGSLNLNTSRLYWHCDSSSYYIYSPKTTYAARLEYSAVDGHAFLGGNVGIGTSIPSYKLHVNGSFYASSGSFGGNSATATSLANARTIWGQSFDGTGNVTGSLSLNTSRLYWHCDSSSYYIYSPKTTYAARLEYSAVDGHAFLGGDVGIGTSSPSYKLHVNGSFYASSGSFGGNSATATSLANARTIWGQSFDGTDDVSGSLSDVGNIVPLSNVAYSIGSTEKCWENAYVKNLYSSTTMYLQSASNCSIIFKINGGTELVRFSTNGNVGIGTTSPSEMLHVVGNAYVTGNISSPTYSLVDSSGIASYLRISHSSQNWYLQCNATYVYLGSSQANSCRVDSSGNFLSPGGITMYGSSDKRLKNNIRTFNASEELMNLGGVYKFEYNDDEVERNGMYKGTHIGLIYQNVKESSLAKMCYEREDGYGALNYLDTSFISLLAAVEIEHETRLQKLERENEELRKEIETLKAG